MSEPNKHCQNCGFVRARGARGGWWACTYWEAKAAPGSVVDVRPLAVCDEWKPSIPGWEVAWKEWIGDRISPPTGDEQLAFYAGWKARGERE